MPSMWRNRKLGVLSSSELEVSIPTHFRCSISLDLMKDPVTVSTGITYDRHSIETWLELGNRTCPVTNQELQSDELIPNHMIRRMIQDWCVAHRSHGVERIPTPRIPVTAAQASEILSEIASASRRGDCSGVRELAAKAKALARESERNRRCFAAAGAARMLAECFSLFAGESSCQSSKIGLLEDILSAVTVMIPMDEEACWHFGSPESLNSIVYVSECGSLEGRLNSVLVLKELVAMYRGNVEFIAAIDGLIGSLVKLIKEPISPQATKASLVAIFYLVSSTETASKVADMGLVPILLELLVDSEKSMSEKVLAVFDSILRCERGKEEAYGHALTVPVLIKKMFRVSDMATEFAVSALWKLCKNSNKDEEGGGGEECLAEALQVGAFQKLLLLLQVGCNGATKEKATEMLKLLNASRGTLECIDTIDFKGLRRPLMR